MQTQSINQDPSLDAHSFIGSARHLALSFFSVGVALVLAMALTAKPAHAFSFTRAVVHTGIIMGSVAAVAAVKKNCHHTKNAETGQNTAIDCSKKDAGK